MTSQFLSNHRELDQNQMPQSTLCFKPQILYSQKANLDNEPQRTSFTVSGLAYLGGHVRNALSNKSTNLSSVMNHTFQRPLPVEDSGQSRRAHHLWDAALDFPTASSHGLQLYY